MVRFYYKEIYIFAKYVQMTQGRLLLWALHISPNLVGNNGKYDAHFTLYSTEDIIA